MRMTRMDLDAIFISMKTLTSNSLDETQKIALDWLARIAAKYSDSDEALVVGLSGHLGAGKTAFVKAVAKELGIMEIVTSPTFVIMKIYELRGSTSPRLNLEEVEPRIWPWHRLVHIDAYRLERPEELAALNFEVVVSDRNNLVIIEWPENVGLKEFQENLHIRFEIKENVYTVSF